MSFSKNQLYIAPLPHWGLLRLTGSEQKSFLHGMISNEVNKLSSGQGSYNTLLTAKGKILADLWVFCQDDSLLILCKDHLAETIAQTLDKYLIMEDATITDESAQWNLLGLIGAETPNALSTALTLTAPESPLTMSQSNDGQTLLFHVPIAGEPGLVLASKAQSGTLESSLKDAGAVAIPAEMLELQRIINGEPACGRELTEDVIPQEALLHHAISFGKGCYIGQETVARLHFRGHVNRELTGFTLSALPPEGEVILMDGEKKVGKVTSCAEAPDGSIVALGYLRCAVREPGKELSATAGDTTLTATVRPIAEPRPPEST